jgi:hypothetical protein
MALTAGGLSRWSGTLAAEAVPARLMIMGTATATVVASRRNEIT